MSNEEMEDAKIEVQAMITGKSDDGGVPWEHIKLLATGVGAIGLKVLASAGSTADERRVVINALWT